MLTGYHSLPRTPMFWEKEDDIGLSIVYESFSGREFEELKRFIHFADNYSLNTNDKFAKVRQLYDITNKNLKKFFFFHLHYLIDEQMVLYTGKNSSKQTIRAKTIRFVLQKLRHLLLMMVILILLIHTLLLNTVVEKRLKILLLGQ